MQWLLTIQHYGSDFLFACIVPAIGISDNYTIYWQVLHIVCILSREWVD